ncbi:phosphopantetheinyl transferase (holo-ACP synthase) [Flavobacterium sp. HSC-32F16]|uniref:4'-phosphopantetheinyl transferase superfamily protein n=1 Tax=Flavobacterium sp. HSC-32F16 TaxID=2910964 RepID=UPI0020A5BFDA|nr:4'-phosphopantetheinyl transferase superfamily protein [Flavobacterium sp. HSC-32F16]MCP2025259.1 phosphopantetheinyl transferase (holo-ACP synthase) [Flavobacterium sp. HSC-32F16]
MIGNDVIDILQSRLESNWQRKGFIEKLFTIEEQLLISKAVRPEIMVWMLWSMKEAAYKIYNRKTKIREYIPKKLVCSIELQNLNSIKGNVICSGNIYHTKTLLSKNKIHTVAVSDLKNLNKVIEIEKKSINKDANGAPYHFDKITKTVMPVSKSHHGRFEICVALNSIYL